MVENSKRVTDYARNRLKVIDLALDKGWEITPVAADQLSMIRERGKTIANYEWTFLEGVYKQAKRYLKKEVST